MAGNFDAETVRYAVIFLIALVISVAVHEFGHAATADRLGDKLPRYQGRVTLNPLAHADPLGTLVFPLMGIFFAGGVLFGWGKPVQVNPMSFTRRMPMKTGHLLVAVAGPIMNLFLVALASVVYLLLVRMEVIAAYGHPAAEILMLIQLNFMLAALNLLPVPPLDGGTILAGILPDRYEHIHRFLQQYGFFILLLLLMTNVLDILLSPANQLAQFWLHMLQRLA